jgi:hypothetical protein
MTGSSSAVVRQPNLKTGRPATGPLRDTPLPVFRRDTRQQFGSGPPDARAAP